jgi:hypothetical protein
MKVNIIDIEAQPDPLEVIARDSTSCPILDLSTSSSLPKRHIFYGQYRTEGLHGMPYRGSALIVKHTLNKSRVLGLALLLLMLIVGTAIVAGIGFEVANLTLGAISLICGMLYWSSR